MRVVHALGMPGTLSPPPLVSDPDMHHGTGVTHVPWCRPVSLTSGFLWSRWRGKRSRHPRRMRNPQFCVSGKRPKQDVILQGLQQKLQTSCSRCNKNTWHVESSYILQPPKYLLLFVNRFRYINDNVTKDRCSITMDTTIMLGPLKFSLRATIDHHGPYIHSGHYTASINCCKKTFYCNDNAVTEFGIIDSKNSFTMCVFMYIYIYIYIHIHIYIYMHSLHEFCYRTFFFSLVYQLCLALW